MNQIIARLGPAAAGGLIADVVRHGGGARGENRQVRAAGALQLQLRILQAVANLIVADSCLRAQRDVDVGFQPCDLPVTELLQRGRRGRVMTVTIDDHVALVSISRPNTYGSDCRPGCAAAPPDRDRFPRTDRPTRRRWAYPS